MKSFSNILGLELLLDVTVEECILTNGTQFKQDIVLIIKPKTDVET